DIAEPAAAEVVARGALSLFRDEGIIDAGIDGIRETRRLLPMVEVETGVHQNGTSGSGWGALAIIASWKPSTAAVVRASACASLRSANRLVQPISAISSAMFFKAARSAACSRSSGSIMRSPHVPGPHAGMDGCQRCARRGLWSWE